MKVLHVTGLMNRGGAEVLIMDFLRYKTDDIKYDFLIHYNVKQGAIKGDFDDEIKERGSNIHHIPTLWNLGFNKYIKKLQEIFKISKPDIIHIHMNGKSGVIAYAAHKSGIKTIITHSHADIKYRGSFLYRLVVNTEFKFQKFLINRYSTEFWGCSIEACNSLFNKSKENKFKVINNSVDVNKYSEVPIKRIEDFKMSLGVPDNAILLGNVGRIVKHKNIDFIIDILSLLVKENPNFYFIYAGREVDKEYHNLVIEKVKKYGLEKHVKYLGLRDDVEVVMNGIDIFIGPALQEGFGLVAVEAQAANKPTFIYKGFPNIVDMKLGHVTFFDHLDAKVWMKNILNLKIMNIDKDVIKNKIIELGFDSQSNGFELSNIYKDLNEGK